MNNLSLADALILTLKSLSVEFMFGVSGANIEHLHDAIYRLGDGKLSAILAKSEFSAALMADGYARAHNTLGVCCATSGAAMLNLATGIAEAYADNVPLLAIVGQPPTSLEGKGAFQDSSGKVNTVDALALWKSITRYTAKITDAKQFWPCLEQALREIFHKNPAPSALLIPRDLFEAQVPQKPVNFSTNLKDYRFYARCTPSSIERLKRELNTAKKPLIILGKYARYHIATDRIKELASSFNCKVATTLADINAFDYKDPHYLGMVGVCGHPKAHSFIKHEADLILIIEDDCSVMTTAGIYNHLNKTIYIGADSTKAQAAVNIDLALEGDADFILGQTLADRDANISNKGSCKSNQRDPKEAPIKDTDSLSASQTIASLSKFLPQVNQAFFDAGNCVSTAAYYLDFPSQVKTIISLGMGGMGYSIPAAIGSQMGNNNGRTVVLIGDGGFLITGLEIQTAIEYNLPILFIVFNNSMHGMCATRQQLFFENRVIASGYKRVNIASTVEGLGEEGEIWARCVTSVKHLEESLNEYYTHHKDKPGLLEIEITVDEMPPFIPFIEAKAKPKN